MVRTSPRFTMFCVNYTGATLFVHLVTETGQLSADFMKMKDVCGVDFVTIG